MKKISDFLLTVFAYGITVCLFAGGASFLGYVAALLIGGDTATELCATIYKEFLPLVIQGTSFMTGIGLLGMYLGKSKALTL